jgi:hypothetical protein
MEPLANVNINAAKVHEGGSQVAYLPACKAVETPRDTHILRNRMFGNWPESQANITATAG